MTALPSAAVPPLVTLLGLVLLGAPGSAAGECPDPVTATEVKEALALAPPLILGFQHEDAERQLISLEVNLTCALGTPSPKDLARLWYYRAIAQLYGLEATGVPSAEGLEAVVERFALARSVDPDLQWDRPTFGPFGEDLWNLSSPESRDQPSVSVDIEGEGTVLIDGFGHTGGDTLNLSPGRHLIQTLEGATYQGSWIDVDPAGPPISIAAALGGALRQDAPPEETAPEGALTAVQGASLPDDTDPPSPQGVGTPPAPSTLEPLDAPVAEAPEDGQRPPPLPDIIAKTPLGAGELSVALNAWAFPNLFAGPSVSLTIPSEGKVYATLGAGVGYGALGTCEGCRPPEGISAIVPVSLEAGARVGEAQMLKVGVGYQGFYGGGFGTAKAVAAGEGAMAAHGLMGAIGLRSGSSTPLSLKISGGVLLAPKAMVGFMGGVSLGVVLGGGQG